VENLSRSDLRAVLEFVETAWGLAGERPFTSGTLAALKQLVPCDVVAYCELDRLNQRTLEYLDSDDAEGDDGGGEGPFWDIVDDHPLCHRQVAYADFSATRLSDVLSRRRFLGSRIYADWFRPAGLVAELEVGIARSRVRTRNFVLDRAEGDFSVRDRAVLEMTRPHLARIHEAARLRHLVGYRGPEDLDRLSAREAEVLELVAAGLTNAAIAERLWISPGTVKKHLEHIYAKLGVRTRTEAAVRFAPFIGGDSRSVAPS
jgi:DNA-binding CsgD family transcriptional regulator